MKKKLFYLTFNDLPGGIYSSQVIDVVKLYQSNGIDARLVALIPARNFFLNRNKIKSFLPESMVFPLFPKLKFWKLNRIWLFFISFKYGNVIIARSIFAYNLITDKIIARNKVVYDGRGAIFAEHNEYRVYEGTGIENNIEELERNAVINSNYRIAVSSKLVKYWNVKYNYSVGEEVIIPCTTSDIFNRVKNKERIIEIKNKFNIKENEVVMIYSGSISGWQSLDYLSNFLLKILSNSKLIKIVFLSEENQFITDLIDEFPNRIFQLAVAHKDVVDYLDAADVGLLLRNQSLTNYVSSPVKCAEYLSRGLKVLISANIGDYSAIIEDNKLGYVIDNFDDVPNLSFIDFDRNHSIEFALKNLSKNSLDIHDNYMSLIK